MSEDLGRWFKVYAAITDHPVFSDSQALRAFLWCIRRACWKRTYSHGKWIPRGSFWCGNRDAATECHSSINTWRQAMATLVELELVTLEATATHTLVTIVNYGKYQGDELGGSVSKIDTPTDTQADTRGDARTDTHNEARTDTRSRSIRRDRSLEEREEASATPYPPSPDPPAKTPKTKPPAFDPLAVPIPPTIDTPRFRAAWQAWIEHRREIRKPLTRHTAIQQVKRFGILGVDVSVETIRESIIGGWQGLFPEKVQARLSQINTNPVPDIPRD